MLVRSIEMSIFLFFNASNKYFRLTNLTIVFITQPIARFFVIFSHFDVYFIKDIDNFIFQIFTFNWLGDTLCYYIVPSSIMISVIYFDFIIYPPIGGLDF